MFYILYIISYIVYSTYIFYKYINLQYIWNISTENIPYILYISVHVHVFIYFVDNIAEKWYKKGNNIAVDPVSLIKQAKKCF